MSELVKVRVAVAVDSGGHWTARGCCCDESDFADMALADLKYGDDHEPRIAYWLTAELPIPQPAPTEDVPATVEAAI